MVYGCILVGFCATAVAMSLAELASMYVSVYCLPPSSADVPERPYSWRTVSLVRESGPRGR